MCDSISFSSQLLVTLLTYGLCFRLLNLEASQVEVRKTTIEASEQQEIEQEYKLFAPVRLAVTNNTAAMKEAYAMVANSFRCGLSNYVDQLSWYTNQSNALSMGFLLLSCSLAYCIHDNMKLKKQMERRGEVIRVFLYQYIDLTLDLIHTYRLFKDYFQWYILIT